MILICRRLQAFTSSCRYWPTLEGKALLGFCSILGCPRKFRIVIYAANTVENVNRGIRKYIKVKVQFADDLAAQKAVYLALMNILVEDC